MTISPNSATTSFLSADSQELLERLQPIAQELQEHFSHENGIEFSQAGLINVLTGWLNDSLDGLIADALYHTVEGDRSFAFNRQDFTRRLSRCPVQPVKQEVAA